MLSRPAGSPGSVDAAIGRTLGSLFNASTTRHVLELSSPVSGDIVARAAKDAQVSLRTVDFNSNWRNAQGDSKSDILVAIDLVNHAPWSTTEALFAHVDDVLDQSAHATLVISSPVKIGGFFRSATDEEVSPAARAAAYDGSLIVTYAGGTRTLGCAISKTFVRSASRPNWISSSATSCLVGIGCSTSGARSSRTRTTGVSARPTLRTRSLPSNTLPKQGDTISTPASASQYAPLR